MGIQINGSTDRITAIDGTIDFVSNIGNIGLITASNYVLQDAITIGAGSTIIKTVNGKLGIGTDNAASDLHINSAVPTIRFTDSDTSQYSDILQSGHSLYISGDRGSSGSGGIIFRTQGTNERLRITSTGILEIERGSAVDQAIDIKTTATTGASRIRFVESGTAKGQIAYSHANDQIEIIGATGNAVALFAGGSQKVKLTSTGEFGINEASPQQQLHVHADTAYHGILINGNAAPSVCFAANTGTTPSFKVGIPGTNNTWFGISTGAGNTNKFTMDGNGKSGFSHNPDTEVLTIGGGQRWTYQSNNWSAGAEGAFLDYYADGSMVRLGHVNGASGSAKHIIFYSGGSQVGKLASDGSTYWGPSSSTEAQMQWAHDTNQRPHIFWGKSGGAQPSDGVVVVASPQTDICSQRVGTVVFGSATSGGSGNTGLKAAIECHTNASPGSDFNAGGDLRFLTKPNNTILAERLRIKSDGEVVIGTNDDNVAKLCIKYSTVPAYITNSYDGTSGESTFSNNIARTSDGSAAWGSFSNSSYGASAVQLLSTTSGSSINLLTSNATNTNPVKSMVIYPTGAVTKPRNFTFLVETNGTSITTGWNKLTGLSIDSGQSNWVNTNYWDGSNQRFTPPVTGTYSFFFGGWGNQTDSSGANRYATCFRISGGSFLYIAGGAYCNVDSPLNGHCLSQRVTSSQYIELWYYSSQSGTWGGGHRVYWGATLLG